MLQETNIHAHKKKLLRFNNAQVIMTSASKIKEIQI